MRSLFQGIASDFVDDERMHESHGRPNMILFRQTAIARGASGQSRRQYVCLLREHPRYRMPMDVRQRRDLPNDATRRAIQGEFLKYVELENAL